MPLVPPLLLALPSRSFHGVLIYVDRILGSGLTQVHEVGQRRSQNVREIEFPVERTHRDFLEKKEAVTKYALWDDPK